jgi:hypothetical protein
MIMVIIMMVVVAVIMVAVLALDVMPMHPMVPVLGPMTWRPGHFPIVVPVMSAVVVVRPIAYLNAEVLRPDGCRENKAHREERDEQESFLNHIL